MPDVAVPRRAVLGVLAAVTGACVVLAGCSPSKAVTTAATPKGTQVPVTTRDIAQTKTETGTVAYGAADAVKLVGLSTAAGAGTTPATTTTVAPGRSGAAPAAGASDAANAATTTVGVITALPALGSTIDRNGSLVEINGLPAAVLMFGSRPMWRTLQDGVPDGPDVRELEENLSALGYGGFTVDDSFTSSTGDAVAKWQASLGLSPTRIVQRDDVVFQPSAVRVSAWSAQPGDAASGAVLSVTGTARIVNVDLAQSDAGLAVPGRTVTITPASGAPVQGTVFAAATQASASDSTGGNSGGGGGGATAAAATTTTHVTIVVPPGTALADGSASVDFTTDMAAGVLAVPVKALLALAEGGYAVQKVTGSSTELTKVTPGQFADGYVEIKTGLVAGDKVVVP
jgi:hypothetical protein